MNGEYVCAHVMDFKNSETADDSDFTVCIIRCVYRAELILDTAESGSIPYLQFNSGNINSNSIPTSVQNP